MQRARVPGGRSALKAAVPSCYRPAPVKLPRSAPPWAQGLAPLVPLLATFAVWAPLRNGYFSGDDFFHLYDLATRPLSDLLGQVWGGHLLVLYNAVLWTMFQAFGTDPRGYAWTVLLTHLLNTALLFHVIRQVIRPPGLTLACFGAMLWGACPALVGALGWYSVYGQVLLTTLVLCVLWSLGRVVRSGRALSTRVALLWTAVLAAGSTSFGTGLGVAAAFPVIVALVLPAGRLTRRSALVLVLGAVLTVVGYQLALVHSPDMTAEARAGVSPLSNPGLLPAAVGLWAHLVGFGASALLFDVVGANQRFPGWTQLVGGGVLTLLLLAAGVGADAAGRRRLLALVLLVAGAYGAVAAGRAAVYAAGRVAFTIAAMVPRYHYLPLALLTVAVCTALGEIAARGPLASRAVSVAAGLWMLGRIAVLVLRPFPIDLADRQRAALEDVFRSIRAQVERTPPGEVALIENKPFGASLYFPALMPGWAGLFVIFSPEDTIDGRPVRFLVSEDDWERARARGGRIAGLVVRR